MVWAMILGFLPETLLVFGKSGIPVGSRPAKSSVKFKDVSSL